jgi:predicted dehydrogenase
MGYARLSNQISVPTGMLSWAAQSGPEWFLFPHTMDLVRWFMARDATRVYATGRKGVLTGIGIDAYDAIQAVVDFGDAFATFETCWVIPNSFPTVTDSTMTLFGTAGRIDVDNNMQGLTITAERFDPRVPYGKFISHGDKQMGYYLEGIHHFVDCILDDQEPLVTGEDGLAVVSMIAAVRQSIAENRAIDL